MVSTTVVQMDNPEFLLKYLFVFIITAALGLFTHMFLVLPVLFLIFARRNPFKHIWHCMKAIVTAFGTDNRYTVKLVTFCVF